MGGKGMDGMGGMGMDMAAYKGSNGGGKGKDGKGKAAAQVVPGATVFIFHVPNSWDEAELSRHFQHCGRMVTCAIQRKDDGESRGFGFISFEDIYAAKKAIVSLNGFMTGFGKFLTVSIKKGEEEAAAPVEAFPPRGRADVAVPSGSKGMVVAPGATLFVFHLPNDWGEEELHRHFIHFGTLLSVTVMRKNDGESRGFGFLSFQYPESATRAIEGMNSFCTGRNKFLKVMHKKGDGKGGGEDSWGKGADMMGVDMSAGGGIASEALAPVSTLVPTGPQMSEQQVEACVTTVKLALLQCFADHLWQTPLDGASPETRDAALTAIASETVQKTAEMLGQQMQGADAKPAAPINTAAPWPMVVGKNNVAQVPPDANVFVFRIPARWSETDLASTFGGYGNILSLAVTRNQDGSSKGFGFVGFDNAEAAQAAIKDLHGAVVEGQTLSVSLKKSRQEGKGAAPY